MLSAFVTRASSAAQQRLPRETARALQAEQHLRLREQYFARASDGFAPLDAQRRSARRNLKVARYAAAALLGWIVYRSWGKRIDESHWQPQAIEVELMRQAGVKSPQEIAQEREVLAKEQAKEETRA